ncbi:MAG: alpha/beta hydrolase [Proteobacteria bacterium]|nr:alpha/beta hydrolase [Pseudomonadota bacterium]
MRPPDLALHRTRHSGGSLAWRVGGIGPPVVLVHGGSGSWTHWIRNIPALGESHQILLPDMPGFGESEGLPLSDSLDPLAGALLDGLRTLIGERSFHLVGFSFGGLVAARMALLARPHVHRLVLVGASGFGLPTSLRLPLKSWRGLAPSEQLAIHAHNLHVLMLAGGVDDDAIQLQAANAQRARLNSRPWSNRPILRHTLGELSLPLGAIWGGCDAILQDDLDRRIAVLRKCDPACPVEIIEGAGHWVAYEAPDRFAAALLPMLT